MARAVEPTYPAAFRPVGTRLIEWAPVVQRSAWWSEQRVKRQKRPVGLRLEGRERRIEQRVGMAELRASGQMYTTIRQVSWDGCVVRQGDAASSKGLDLTGLWRWGGDEWGRLMQDLARAGAAK
ncbi:hypothetical protein CYMTET_36404 [Cymbomonas tetramitiformis]|uniref:Uncharacterized protein n=1 Tax=Cymbomonas tetramitiformis TaxID=36881 RepID=A0AAE0CIC0_9CHLO|nr:hypothetical protein CYMTET_36404 [Cymbomonas tetramitiformis]